jgi:asparagine synthase (glutamine-hydrolysing)
MCEISKHRGPDDTDYFLDKNVGLGINRLKIIDLKKGDQPIHNEDGSIWIVFNGEIYNYPDLRKELEGLGHRFYTDSDTETIVHSYEEWSADCVQHLRGMFAFAIWDGNRRSLYLARDRFGKKPLFYTTIGGVFLFASEIKSILQYEDVNRRSLNREALDYFLTFMYVPAPMTIFDGIFKLPAGHHATLEEGGRLQVRRYWDMSLAPDNSLTERALVDLLYDGVQNAVKIRMRSDVPLGAFLSGGIDSSTVVSMMTRLSPESVKTVSIGFESDDKSELPFARMVAQRLKTDHQEYVVRPEAHKILPQLIWHFDEPFADHSLIPTYYLSEVTRRKVTVALSGDGGDEMFMGYPFLTDPESYSYFSRVPELLRKPILRVMRSLPVDAQFRRMANHAYEKGYGDQPFDERYAMRVSLYDSNGLNSLYSKEDVAGHLVSDTYGYMRGLIKEKLGSDPLAAVDYATIKSYLQDDILVKVDRMSMAVSLEVRCPLLDQELANLVGRIPSRLKLRGTTTKYIMKKMVVEKGLLPSSIANRRKQGFGAPIEGWMQKEWREVVAQGLDPLLTGRIRTFDVAEVKKLASDPYVNSNKLFALIVFVIWHRIYMEQATPKIRSIDKLV